MSYDAKPTVEDVILFADDESASGYVALLTRVGVGGLGVMIKEWGGAEIDWMLGLGLLRKSVPGPVAADDTTFVDSAFQFCFGHALGPLHSFERNLARAVAGAEERLDAAYEGLDMEKLSGVRTPVEEAAILAACPGSAPFSNLSDWRLKDVQRHLGEVLEARLSQDGPTGPGAR